MNPLLYRLYVQNIHSIKKKEFTWIMKSRFKVQASVFLLFHLLCLHNISWLQMKQTSVIWKEASPFSGRYLLLIGGRIKVSQRAKLFSAGKGSIYLARPLSTCFLPWADPMVNPLRMKWKRILLHFFSYNDAPGAIVSWQNLQTGVLAGKIKHFSCMDVMPVVLSSATKTNINVRSLLLE